MTPKEKAKELIEIYVDINEFYNLQNNNIVVINYNFGKQCALIAVDEIIGQWEIIDVYLANGNGQLNQNLEYWYKVKKEINKL